MDERLANTRIGFIGAGNMALAIAQGLILKNVIPKVTAISGPHPENYKKNWGAFTELIVLENWKVLNFFL